MFTTCGKLGLSEGTFSHLRDLGHAIHAGHQPLVFDGGFVSLVEQRESEVNCDAKRKSGSGPETRPRQGRRTSRRSRPSGQTQPFRSRAIEEAHGSAFRILAQHYDALAFEQDGGLWVTVKSRPLGSHGPQAHLLIAAPNDARRRTAGWAFEGIGSHTKPFPLKHTNFPDASICAFTAASKAWVSEDGLLPLVDHYSLWAVKSWHRQVFGLWPGDQVGACALYRRKEFVAEEWCGCGSGKRYSECHLAPDMLVSEDYAQQEFKRLFHVSYDSRALPHSIIHAARTRWKTLPSLSSIIP